MFSNNLEQIFKTVILVAIFYLCLSVIFTLQILCNKKEWIPEFRERMKDPFFIITMFFYLPISHVKGIFGKRD